MTYLSEGTAAMHLTTVFSHPFRDRYPAAVMDAFHEPFRQRGAEIDVIDLHAEGFDPRFTEADHDHFWGGALPEGIAQMHRRVEAADRLAFVFPVYWWGMPALMKGWIERVFTPGWAYQYGRGIQDRGKTADASSLLPSIPTILLGIGGSKEATYDKYGYDAAMRTQLDVGTLAYCGLADTTSHLIFDVEGAHNAGNRRDGLAHARSIAQDFVRPDRAPRDARQDHLAERGAMTRT